MRDPHYARMCFKSVKTPRFYPILNTRDISANDTSIGLKYHKLHLKSTHCFQSQDIVVLLPGSDT